jgi:hypothetical protein
MWQIEVFYAQSSHLKWEILFIFATRLWLKLYRQLMRLSSILSEKLSY